MTSSLAIGLLFAAASCGSDEQKSAESTATEISSAVSSAVSAAQEAVDTIAVDVPAVGAPDVSGLTAAQAQVVTQTLEAAAAQGIVFDQECFINLVAQLSEEDAQLIADAGPDASPEVSPAGQQIGAQVAGCAIEAPTTTG